MGLDTPKESFQFFLISTGHKPYSPLRCGLSVLSYFDMITVIKPKNKENFQFFLISTGWPSWQSSKNKLSVLSYFDRSSTLKLYSSYGFQFFLISTRKKIRLRRTGQLSVLSYFDGFKNLFPRFCLKLSVLSYFDESEGSFEFLTPLFQFFLISTGVSPTLGVLGGILSVLSYFDSKDSVGSEVDVPFSSFLFRHCFWRRKW